MRMEYTAQLEQMHEDLVHMGGLCEQAITLAARCLKHCDPDLQQDVGRADEKIDRAERDIENQCLRLLLRQQPVAGDLRKVSAAINMISDMERIGDQASDIAELAPYVAGKAPAGSLRLDDMARAVVRMVTDSVDAFVRDDLTLARAVMDADDEVDTLFEQVKEELMQLIRDGGIDAQASLDLLMAAKYFERIGDHAVNIAEWVEYSITGEHNSSEHHMQVEE